MWIRLVSLVYYYFIWVSYHTPSVRGLKLRASFIVSILANFKSISGSQSSVFIIG